MLLMQPVAIDSILLQGEERMIDVEKEIEGYCALEPGPESFSSHAGLEKALGVFSDAFKRLGKEQYKYAKQLDEIMILLEDAREDEKENREDKQELKARKREVEGLQGALLDLLDSLEDIYRYARQSGQGAWEEQVMMQWMKVLRGLEGKGISIIQAQGQPFNLMLHTAREVRELGEYPHGYILEVIRHGYAYQGKVIRKAEVVVNKRE